MYKLQKKPSSLKRKDPTLQNMNFFFLSWIRIRIPDTLARLNPDPIGIRILSTLKKALKFYLQSAEIAGYQVTQINHFFWYVKIRPFLYNFNFWKVKVPYLFPVDAPE
jgi:hypothetical protein